MPRTRREFGKISAKFQAIQWRDGGDAEGTSKPRAGWSRGVGEGCAIGNDGRLGVEGEVVASENGESRSV